MRPPGYGLRPRRWQLSALAALRSARAAGVSVQAEGENLKLEASAPPPAEVLEALRQFKRESLELLRVGADGWSGLDWHDHFEERAAIAGLGGALPQDQAEAHAWSGCISNWLRLNPVRSRPGECARCGDSHGLLQPYLEDLHASNPGHVWLHQSCSQPWYEERRAAATAALGHYGLGALERPLLRGGTAYTQTPKEQCL